MPYYPEEKKGHKHNYEINTIEEKLISEYTGLNFLEIENLDVIEYWVYLRDAVIYRYNETEEGQEYLEKCWIIEQTNPDRNNLRDRFNKN